MFKAIIQDFKEYIRQLNEWLFIKRFGMKLFLARKLADMKQKAFNKQYFVILDSNRTLIAINNIDVEQMKRTRMYNDNQLRSIKKSFKKNEDQLILELMKNGLEHEEINVGLGVSEIRSKFSKEFEKLKQQRLLDKRVDGITLRKKAFYYTSESDNNKMTPEQIKEGRERYLRYSDKYMRKMNK